MKITYTRVGDYYLPNLVAPESPKVGRWGMLRFNYLRKHRETLYTIMLSHNTEDVFVDTVLLLLILVIEVVLQTTDVILLSPDLRAATKDLESYRADYRFLQENGIRTITQLEIAIPEIQSQIDNLETERSKADNTRRRARTPEAQQEAKDRKKELTQKIAPLRKKLRQAKKILDESPHLYELLQEEHRLERAAYQRFRERMK